MNAAIITIGDELIQGFTLDSNSSWISRYILDYGIKVDKVVSIGDDSDEIKKSIDEFILEEYSLIFLTGGLGPTHDDISKKALKEYFEASYCFDKKHHEKLKKIFLDRGIDFNASQKSQSQILSCSKKINNHCGSALGMYIEFSKSKIFVLPGVPREMKAMLEKEIFPKFLISLKKKNITYCSILTTGVNESKLSDLLSSFIKSSSNKIKLSFLPHYHGVDIRINMIKSNDQKSINYYKNKIVNIVDKYIYGYNDDTINGVINTILQEKNISLSLAESCTGGLIAKMITSVPGSSKVFLGGVVAYSNKLKIKLLNINKEKISKYGAVSKEISEDMCRGIINITGSDAAISTTGLSGPNGDDNFNIPIGIVYITICYMGFYKTKKFLLPFQREVHQKVTSHVGLNMLRKFILKKSCN